MMAAAGLRRALGVAAGVVALSAVGGAAWVGYRSVVAQPVQRVSFAGDLDRLRPADLEALAQAIRSAGNVSLESMREAAKRVPWVRDATVRRVFPDAAQITFEAHRAFAHWNDGHLVSARGEVFAADFDGDLPRLRGPEGSAAAMVEAYAKLEQALSALGSPIRELRLSARGAWQALLATGLTLEMGRGDIGARAARLVAAWPQVAERAQEARYLDLRYPNGFAMQRAKTADAGKPGSVAR